MHHAADRRARAGRAVDAPQPRLTGTRLEPGRHRHRRQPWHRRRHGARAGGARRARPAELLARSRMPIDPGIPETYRSNRAQTAASRRRGHSRGLAARRKPSRPTCATRPRRAACSMRPRQAFGPVEILVNNATGWRADTFAGQTHGSTGSAARASVGGNRPIRCGRSTARGSALMIAEFSRRHIARGATGAASSA